MAAGGHRHLPVVDLESGEVEGAPTVRVGMAYSMAAGGRRTVAALMNYGCRPDRDARHPGLLP
jgi:hypothetical protein